MKSIICDRCGEACDIPTGIVLSGTFHCPDCMDENIPEWDPRTRMKQLFSAFMEEIGIPRLFNDMETVPINSEKLTIYRAGTQAVIHDTGHKYTFNVKVELMDFETKERK